MNEVEFDASRSLDADNNPCIQFTFDFGDKSEIITQKSPFIKHTYKNVGIYDVKLMVKDNNDQTAKAMVTQRVINIKPVDNILDVDDIKHEALKNDDIDGDPDGLGQQFRIVMNNAIGLMLEDPNKEIAEKGKRLIDVMKELNPEWIDSLDGSITKRYNEMEFPMKPYKVKEPPNKPISIKSGDPEQHVVKTLISGNLISQYPDI